VYPHSPTLTPDAPELSYFDDAGAQNRNDGNSEIERHVQAILGELEQLPPETQVAVYSRLLNGLATKLTSAVVTKSIAAAKVDQSAPAKPKVTSARSGGAKASGRRKTPVDDVPRADSMLRQLNDATDPIEAWDRFGGSAAQLFDVLKEEPTGVLEAMLRHRNMPPGTATRSKSREKLAENIAVRLEQHFRGN